MKRKATPASGAAVDVQAAQLPLPGTMFPAPGPGAHADIGEATILARIESAKRIIQKHPEVSFEDAMLALTPLPRVAYTLKEAARALGVSYISTYRLVKRGKLKASTALPGRTLIPVREVEAFLKR